MNNQKGVWSSKHLFLRPLYRVILFKNLFKPRQLRLAVYL
ncbi:hypothetical protein SK642_1525 [Streptococcus mitis]|uniref:Uncharacterized protein n=1 Tax=Streptococcus mitis TaxID=28037 RepID=A0A081QBE4_STRMT|nr:hypothetical protein SK642_1525 [Streptococcus mitis]